MKLCDITWEQFHSERPSYYSGWWVWKLYFYNMYYTPLMSYGNILPSGPTALNTEIEIKEIVTLGQSVWINWDFDMDK